MPIRGTPTSPSAAPHVEKLAAQSEGEPAAEQEEEEDLAAGL